MMTRAPPRVNAIAAAGPSPDAEPIATAHIPSNELMQTLSSFYGALASSTSCVWKPLEKPAQMGAKASRASARGPWSGRTPARLTAACNSWLRVRLMEPRYVRVSVSVGLALLG